MAETSTIFGFMKYVSATDILSDFKKTVDSHFVNSLNTTLLSCVTFKVVEKDRFELPNQKELSYSQPRLATSLLLQFLKKEQSEDCY